MIPIKLTLSNFMPYTDNVPPLSFAGIHIASICGDNGSGKSSLVDAMTWALWGRSRAKSDDDLIHQGQSYAQVEFEFAVGEQVYRIMRKHARPKNRRSSGQSSLDLFVAAGGAFKPISGDRIGETQNKITDILHMDYDTFINSSFLRQGHADEFTVAKPTERKTVLTNILGLSVYDKLEERARETAGQRSADRVRLASAISEIDAELAHKAAYEADLSGAQVQLANVELQLAECQSRLNSLRDQRELFRAKQQQAAHLEEQIVQTGRDLKRWVDQAEQHRRLTAEYETLLDQKATIEDRYSRLILARRADEDLSQKLRLATGLRERRHQLEMMVEKSSQVLLREHAVAENRIGDLQKKHGGLEGLRASLQQAHFKLGRLAELEAGLHTKRQEYQATLADLRQLESDRARTEAEIREVGEKLDLLSSQVGATCPLCERELGASHLELIKAKYTEEKRAKSAALKFNQAETDRHKGELAHLETELGKSETSLMQSKSLAQSEAGLLERQIAEAGEAGAQLEEQKSILAGIEERLAKKEFALAEQEATERLESQIAALGYDAAYHEAVRTELAELGTSEAPKRRLEEAERLIVREKESASQAEQAAGELRANLEAHNQRKADLTRELEGLPGLIGRLSQTEEESRELGGGEKLAREGVARARERVNRCAQLEAVRIDRQAQLDEATREEAIYRELAEAFGKRGVQALLLEMALPEIEAEANRLLARMTDNRMHVRFETQRETKKGGVIETLDIFIADELGTRSYEMFSGGEAFRINFAIRIALSKVLARRAGAPLPTLIIDEGFGTQDATGMEKLREAITSVEADFEMILVITHIEDFRDAFPVRIDVVKTPEGSTISMS